MKFKIKKGLDLKLNGAIADHKPIDVRAMRCAIMAEDFLGMVPRLSVAEGDTVCAGDPLLYNKDFPEMAITSPITGRVSAVVRGERRKIIRVEVEASQQGGARKFDVPISPKADDVMRLLAESGLLAMIRRRPYDVVATPADKPRDIFVTAIDSAPLAIDPWQAVAGPVDHKALEAAAAALLTLGARHIYISSRAGLGSEIKGTECVEIDGPHPAGLASTLIGLTTPINKGELVWTMGLDVMIRLGRLLTTGYMDYSTLVAVTGPELVNPYVAATTIGADVKPLLRGHLADDGRHKRIISGDVLTGTIVGDDGFLRAPYRQLTVIAEGDDVVEFMGWASVSPSKMSFSRALPLHFLRKAFSPDARLNGSPRAMIQSGQYERVVPLDIMPEFLIRAIKGRDIDEMERLGIYEVAPEDFALAEFVDASKMPLQQIVRDGLDYLRKELE